MSTPSKPLCYKCTCTSNRFTTCRLSRFCHHCLISATVGPRLLCTCKYISERTRTPCTLQGHLLHSCVMSKLAQVTSHLHVLTLVCQVTCEWYSIYTYMMYFPNQQKMISTLLKCMRSALRSHVGLEFSRHSTPVIVHVSTEHFHSDLQ